MYVFCITMFQITDFPATEPGAGAHERHPRGSPTAQQESGGGAPNTWDKGAKNRDKWDKKHASVTIYNPEVLE